MLLVVACSRTHADRRHWQRMSPNEKSLYVRSLLGHEKAKAAKGGNDRQFPLAADEYVRRIDRAYASGDTRDVDDVFAGLAATPPTRRPPPASP